MTVLLLDDWELKGSVERVESVDVELKDVCASAIILAASRGGGSEGRGGGDDTGLNEGLSESSLIAGLSSALAVGGREVKDTSVDGGSLLDPATVSMTEAGGDGLGVCVCDASCCGFVTTLLFSFTAGVGVAEAVLRSDSLRQGPSVVMI